MIKGISEIMNKGLQVALLSVMLFFNVLSYAEASSNNLDNIDFRVNKLSLIHI